MDLLSRARGSAANSATYSCSTKFRNALHRFLACVLVILAGSGVGVAPTFASTSTGETPLRTAAAIAVQTQRVAVPSYFYPGPLWARLEGSVSQGAGLAIINPNSGPGTSVNPDYIAQIALSQGAGLAVLGYVYTDYGRRSQRDVEADIDAYYQWYGVDGIFFDEASNDDDASIVAYYQDIHDHVKAQTGDRLVVINPGTRTEAVYLATADIIVTFEGNYDSYAALDELPPAAWEWDYPAERFWHLVHETAEADLLSAVALTKQRNAGWIYVTPDVMDNPWDTLPPAAYWTNLLDAATSSGADQACRAPMVDRIPYLLRGTITSDDVNLRARPGLDCEIIGRFSEGDTVQILSSPADIDGRTWIRVADEQGVQGWVVEEFVEYDDSQPEIAL